MGNTSSASLKVKEGKAAQVAFDLRHERVVIRYQLAALKGRFEIPLKLGERTVELPDAASLARSGALEIRTYPLDLEERDRLPSSTDIPALEGGGSLLRGAPVSIRSVVWEGEWVRAGRMDSDLGALIVLSRVRKEFRTWVQLDIDRRNWIGRKRSWVVGRATGTLQVAVRARFETHGDRSLLGKLLQHAVSGVRSILQLLTGRFRPGGGSGRDLPSTGAGAGVLELPDNPVQSPWGSQQHLEGSLAPPTQTDLGKVQEVTKGKSTKEEEPCKTM